MGAVTFIMASAIGVNVLDIKSPKVRLSAGAVSSMLFTSLYGIFSYRSSKLKFKMSYDREHPPRSKSNMKFIVGSHVISKILPKLIEQHVMLIFISPPSCIYHTMYLQQIYMRSDYTPLKMKQEHYQSNGTPPLIKGDTQETPKSNVHNLGLN